jgi:hypothetical protein
MLVGTADHRRLRIPGSVSVNGETMELDVITEPNERLAALAAGDFV